MSLSLSITILKFFASAKDQLCVFSEYATFANKTHVLAILDDQVVTIHEYSVKWTEWFVHCYENVNAIWCQPESAMFCTHLSHFGYAVQLLPGRGFSYRVCDEEMSKSLLVLTLLKIIRILLTIA